MENNFHCFTCQKKPFQFTILLCDHLVCSRCLDSNLKKLKDISMIQCRCRVKTYCNENDMRNSLKTPQMAEAKKINNKNKYNDISNTQVSNFFLPQQSEISYNINLEVTSELKNDFPFLSNKSFLKTQPLILSDHNDFQQQNSLLQMKQHAIIKGVKNITSIQSSSPLSAQKFSQAISLRKQNNSWLNNITKDSIPLKASSMPFKASSIPLKDKSMMHIFNQQLRKQIKFLHIQYEKDVQKCQNLFHKIIKALYQTFDQCVRDLQTNYNKIIHKFDKNHNDNITMQQISFNLPHAIRRKYDINIAQKISKLHQNLMNFLDMNIQTQKSPENRIDRKTVYLQKNLPLSHDKVNQTNKRSKSKKCAFYLAISPKEKNDRVINYIQVIRNQISKKKLTKKSIKGDRLRIY